MLFNTFRADSKLILKFNVVLLVLMIVQIHFVTKVKVFGEKVEQI